MTNTLHDHNETIAGIQLPTRLEAAPVSVAARRIPRRKRAFDLLVAIPAALVTLPLTAALAVGCAIRYRQAPLFDQPRIGRGGQVFKFWKVRTLPKFAPDTADKYQLDALDLPNFARKLRYHHLDEFPQLWLVVAGRMSLVGPRPEMPTLSASFDEAFVAERVSVQPGCTGLWQISTSARKLIGEAPEFDTHYVRNWTLRLDLWVAMRTLPAMMGGNEITSLSEIPRWTGAAVR
jgi:lipopolysaccharide/colanic/teichoic acid biosynthesis glycosyltransferase